MFLASVIAVWAFWRGEKPAIKLKRMNEAENKIEAE